MIPSNVLIVRWRLGEMSEPQARRTATMARKKAAKATEGGSAPIAPAPAPIQQNVAPKAAFDPVADAAAATTATSSSPASIVLHHHPHPWQPQSSIVVERPSMPIKIPVKKGNTAKPRLPKRGKKASGIDEATN